MSINFRFVFNFQVTLVIMEEIITNIKAAPRQSGFDVRCRVTPLLLVVVFRFERDNARNRTHCFIWQTTRHIGYDAFQNPFFFFYKKNTIGILNFFQINLFKKINMIDIDILINESQFGESQRILTNRSKRAQTALVWRAPYTPDLFLSEIIYFCSQYINYITRYPIPFKLSNY